MSNIVDDDSDDDLVKVVEDHGPTPGNDRALKLECGHVILVDTGGGHTGGDVFGPPNSWLGGKEHCYYCVPYT